MTVIDFCLTRTLVCDEDTNYQSLRLSWASKTSSNQRKGKALVFQHNNELVANSDVLKHCGFCFFTLMQILSLLKPVLSFKQQCLISSDYAFKFVILLSSIELGDSLCI